jgi:hypothetical protein
VPAASLGPWRPEADGPHRCVVPDGSFQGHAGHASVLELGRDEKGDIQAGVSEICTVELYAGEVRSAKVCADQSGTTEIGFGEISPFEVCA